MAERSMISPYWGIVRFFELEGIYPEIPNVGNWLNWTFRILRGWGATTIEDYPYGPTHMETGKMAPASSLDHIAKQLRIDFFHRVWDSNDCQFTLARESGVTAAFFVSEQWRSPPLGKIDFDQADDKIEGVHSVGFIPPRPDVPIPIDWNESKALPFTNSWGLEWGNRGFGAMTPHFFDNHMIEGWAFDSEFKLPKRLGRGIQHCKSSHQISADRVYLAYDIVDVEHDDRLAWGVGVIRRGELHVDDIYVKPAFRRNGYGRQIVTNFVQTAVEYNLPVRFWIPFSDVDTDEHRDSLFSFAKALDLRLELSPRQWAAYCAFPGRYNTPPPLVKLPPKAAFTFEGKPAV